MIKGIGIDTVRIERIRRLMARHKTDALLRIFTESEMRASAASPDPAAYLAVRFAAKEAVFKAVAHLTPSGRFDLRLVETLNDENGCPFVTMTDTLTSVMAEAGVTQILVSATTEAGLATVVAAAQ